MMHKPVFTALDLPEYSWLKIINPSAILRNVRHALFDFDGTISLIRRGWETIMIPMMVEMICGEYGPSPEIISEVEDYVDRSTGILTIKQMQWLVQTVEHYGYVQQPLTAHAYKKLYNERLLLPVKQRIKQMDGSQSARDQLMVSGARIFLQALQDQGIKLYLASGTDHEYVIEEARILGVSDYFESHIYGARDDTPAYTKERIIQDIIQTNDLRGEQLMVVGDGPVEIQHAKANGALALGVAADESKRQGFNIKKVQRLKDAGADLIIAGFERHKELLDLLCFTDAQP
ncbi:MAG: HAD family hydrolase [Anaerolineales bacterium]|nr:MAG: HAD family hydrolase [Anaerolineales bacterium]